MSLANAFRSLTQPEFEQLLQRAVERDAVRQPRLFSLPELVAAGQELGIAPDGVEEVYAEYERNLQLMQQAQQLQPRVRARPLGTAVVLAKSPTLFQMTIPAPQVSAAPLKLAVGVLGVAIAVAWATGIVSFPIVLGLAALTAAGFYGVSRLARQPSHELRLYADGSGLLIRTHGSRVETKSLVPGQTYARHASIVESDRYRGTKITYYIALDHGTQTFELLADYTHAERVWAVDEIEQWLAYRR